MKKIYSILTAIALAVALLASGQSAWAANSWSVEYTNGKFRITRSGDLSLTETVQYRTVSLSAIEGQHFTATTGSVTFGTNETTKDISVPETTPTGTYAGRYNFQNGTTRSYRFEVLDTDGFYLAHKDRDIITGTSVPSSNIFTEKSLSVFTSPKTITEDGYDQSGRYNAVPISSYFSSAAPQAYLKQIGAALHLTVELEAAEYNDGYQHIQILVNETTNCDHDNKDDKPGTINYSHYLGCFSHNQSSTPATTYEKYSFPVTSVGNWTYSNTSFFPWTSLGNNIGELRGQVFRNGCRASSDGKLIIPTDLSTLGIRFDAGGSGEDDWYVKNVYAKITAIDDTAPTLAGDPVVSSGPYNRGNSFYISVPFKEIVTISGNTRKLATSWGDATYEAGSGSNVLTFKGTINANAGTTLSITGLEGAIADLAGNTFSGSLNKTFAGITSADPTYSISYDLDGGTVATANPTSYTYTSGKITLKNPSRLGYRFDGWTGSNGSTPQTSVIIAKNSHGHLSYTANWTQLWTGSGTQGSPYTITTTEGLDSLASIVNAGNDCGGLYFQLGDDIAYTATSVWNNTSSQENNFTSISTISSPFSGHFDGQGHTVSGIRIYQQDNGLGLFGRLGSGGSIRRVVLANTRITGCNDLGGIAGEIDINAVIEYCTVGADVALFFDDPQGDGSFYGGITGRCGGNVRYCISSATLIADKKEKESSPYGGIAGNVSYSGKVSHCIAKDVVISTPGSPAGAIFGRKTNESTLTDNYYRSCTVKGVQNQSDVFLVTLPAGVTLPARTNPATLPGTGNCTYNTGACIDGVDYYKQNAKITLDGTAPLGYHIAGYTVTKDGTDPAETVEVTEKDGVFSFMMPACDVTVSASYAPIPWSGNGSEAEPWLIRYPSQLDLLAERVNSGTGDSYAGNGYDGKFFKLDADISYSHGDGETENNYTAIGSKDHSFKGNFDGDGHTVRGIRIYSTHFYQGLFGFVRGGGTIQNVTLADAVISGASETGGIVGHFGHYDDNRTGLVCNCIVESDVFIKASVTGPSEHGGIAGSQHRGIVRACVSSATISHNGSCDYFGGISGERGSTIEYCLAVDVSISARYNKGSITGSTSATMLFQNYYYQCSVSHQTENIGIGTNTSHSKDITNNDGAVEAVAFSSKPAGIGAQTASYPGGITVYEHGLAYKGVYYIAKNRVEAPVNITLVQGTKDGVTAWWGTFYDSTTGYTLSDGAVAYTMNDSHNLYRLGDDGRIIPKDKPVVIISTVPVVTIVPTANASAADHTDTSNRPLKGVDVETQFDSACVLTVNGKGEVGFYQLQNVTIPAHKAYFLP